MTESDWLALPDLVRAVEWNHLQTRPRKLRLFGVACCRLLDPLLYNDHVRAGLRAAERFADGEIDRDRLYDHQFRVYQAHANVQNARESAGWYPHEIAYAAVEYLCQNGPRSDVPGAVRMLLAHTTTFDAVWKAQFRAMFPRYLHDIFGNPFRPVPFAEAWRTTDAVGLARTIYADHASGRLPILADALEEAGCDVPDVLDHCREPDAVHVRGCWVVDGVLGKG